MVTSISSIVLTAVSYSHRVLVAIESLPNAARTRSSATSDSASTRADGVEFRFRALSASFVHQPKHWRDAYFAAFALAADAELVTFDSGFRSFAGLRYRILVP
jgi:predicted nucleic acid-binding protein